MASVIERAADIGFEMVMRQFIPTLAEKQVAEKVVLTAGNVISFTSQELLDLIALRAKSLGLDPVHPAFDLIPSVKRREAPPHSPLEDPNPFYREWQVLKLFPNQVAIYGLAAMHGWSAESIETHVTSEFVTVKARAWDPSGRAMVRTGIKATTRSGWKGEAPAPLKGEDLANAIMAAETKACLRALRALAALAGLDLGDNEQPEEPAAPQPTTITLLNDFPARAVDPQAAATLPLGEIVRQLTGTLPGQAREARPEAFFVLTAGLAQRTGYTGDGADLNAISRHFKALGPHPATAALRSAFANWSGGPWTASEAHSFLLSLGTPVADLPPADPPFFDDFTQEDSTND